MDAEGFDDAEKGAVSADRDRTAAKRPWTYLRRNRLSLSSGHPCDHAGRRDRQKRVVLPDGLSEPDIKTTKNLSNDTLFSKF